MLRTFTLTKEEKEALKKEGIYTNQIAVDPIKFLSGDNKIEKVVFKEPETILITKSGKKIKSVATDEKFDKEKGLLMCIAKMNGINYSKLNKLIDNAVEVKKKQESFLFEDVIEGINMLFKAFNVLDETERLQKKFDKIG